MLIVEYDPTGGTPVRDGDCDVIAKQLAEVALQRVADHYTPRYSTENIFYALAVLVKRKVIDYKVIQFLFQGHFIKIEESGQIMNGYSDFISYCTKKLMELV